MNKNRVPYFANVRNGKIVTVVSAVPPHELLPSQIELTKEEYNILSRALIGGRSLDSVIELLLGVQKKAAEHEANKKNS